MIIEKKHRLPLEAYRGYTRVSFTACILRRARYFISQDRFEIHRDHLLRALKQHECESDLYVFMPDHVHVIITGMSTNADAYTAMKKFKQYSGFWLGRHGNEVQWQEDFYDHIHRVDEDLRTQMFYILNNPVRAGLCDQWQDYPFVGSTVFDLKTWFGDAVT